MLFNIILLICSFGLARSLKCHVTNHKCKIEFQFDQPLVGDAKWSQKCLTLMEIESCHSIALVDYVTQVVEVQLDGSKNPQSLLPTNDSTFTLHEFNTDFHKTTNVEIVLEAFCNTKDTCATDIIQSLIPKFNTKKGRSLDIYGTLKALLIDPSAQSPNKKGDISCFQSATNTTARCTVKEARACTVKDVKLLSVVLVGCTNETARSLKIGYTQQIISQKPKLVDHYSIIVCDRDNCNGPAVHQRVLDLSDKFLEGTYVSNAAYRSSSIFGIGLFFLIIPMIASQH